MSATHKAVLRQNKAHRAVVFGWRARCEEHPWFRPRTVVGMAAEERSLTQARVHNMAEHRKRGNAQ